VFDVLDPDRDQGRVYRVLAAAQHPSDVDRVAAATGLSTAVTTRVLGELSDLGAAAGNGDGWVARPPVRVMSEVLRAEEARRTALWQAGAELDDLYHAALDANRVTGIEPVTDLEELFALTERVQESARDGIRWLDRPPYRSTPDRFAAQESLQARRMADGVAYRTLYHQAVYDDTSLFASMTRMVEAGEDARVLADLPVKLLICDDHTALLVPEPARSGVAGSLVVHASGLLKALCGLFETLWTLGVPVVAAEPSERLSERDRTIITLMAAGLTDDAIARRLQLSRRTVVRGITALLDRLGATTRFQAGVQAANRGWL
jgi:DNA-binding CsgD family transcriptional regulator